MGLANQRLLDTLNRDEKKVNQQLYTAGPYWAKKARKINRELKQKGLSDFRGYDSGVGTSYCDNVISNMMNETNPLLKLFLSLPLASKAKQLLRSSQHQIEHYHKEKKLFQQFYLSKNSRLNTLLKNYAVNSSTEFGCVDTVTIASTSYSVHYLEILNTLDHIASVIDLSKVNTMFEIGGGFGANLHLMLQNFKNLRKVIYLDIVPNLYVGTEYLKHFYPDSVIDYTQTQQLSSLQFSNDDSLEIYCIAPWQIEHLDVQVDYFHNAHSFVEMPQDVVSNYLYYVQKFLRTDGKIALVSYDHFSESNTIAPKKIQNLIKLPLQYHEHPLLTLLNRKNIYLIS